MSENIKDYPRIVKQDGLQVGSCNTCGGYSSDGTVHVIDTGPGGMLVRFCSYCLKKLIREATP